MLRTETAIKDYASRSLNREGAVSYDVSSRLSAFSIRCFCVLRDKGGYRRTHLIVLAQSARQPSAMDSAGALLPCLSQALSDDTVDGRIKYHPDMGSGN